MYKKIINLLLGLLLLLLFTILIILGKRLSSDLCCFIFKKIGYITKLNKIAIKNILFVWPDKKHDEIKKITSNMWGNIGRNFGEFMHLKNYNPLICNHTKIIGLKNVQKLISQTKHNKKGIIFVSAHYGNWELGPIIISKLNLEPLCLYRKSNNKFINLIIQKVRSSFGTYAPKGDIGAKKSFIWLRKGKALALLNDQKLNEGPLINFLGKKASTASFVAELSLRMGLDIIPIKFSRASNHKTSITFYKRINRPNRKLAHSEKVIKILTDINFVIGSWITDDPNQWLWIHRRWPKKIYKT